MEVSTDPMESSTDPEILNLDIPWKFPLIPWKVRWIWRSWNPDVPWKFPPNPWKVQRIRRFQNLQIHGIGGNFHGISRFQDLGTNRQFLPIFYHAIWGWLGCMAGLNTCNCILPGFCTELSEVENKWNICWNGLCGVSFFVERLFKMGQ